MPWYRIGGSICHIRMDKRQAKKAAPPCPFFRWDRAYDGDTGKPIPTGERIKVRCMAMAPFLCDWPGCNAPFCEAHRLNLGPDVDVCPTHNHRRGLFSRLLPAPQGAST